MNYKAANPGLYKTKKPLAVIIFTTEYKSQNALIRTLVKSLMWFYTHLDKMEWYKNIYKTHRQLKSNTCKGSWWFYSFHLKCCCSTSGTSLFAQGTFTAIQQDIMNSLIMSLYLNNSIIQKIPFWDGAPIVLRLHKPVGLRSCAEEIGISPDKVNKQHQRSTTKSLVQDFCCFVLIYIPLNHLLLSYGPRSSRESVSLLLPGLSS